MTILLLGHCRHSCWMAHWYFTAEFPHKLYFRFVTVLYSFYFSLYMYGSMLSPFLPKRGRSLVMHDTVPPYVAWLFPVCLEFKIKWTNWRDIKKVICISTVPFHASSLPLHNQKLQKTFKGLRILCCKFVMVREITGKRNTFFFKFSVKPGWEKLKPFQEDFKFHFKVGKSWGISVWLLTTSATEGYSFWLLV